MKNGRKVILGVALSLMILFTAVGYAALSDQLFISGDLFATAPDDIYIKEIVTNNASIVGYTGINTTISGNNEDEIVYAMIVRNNHANNTYVYTGLTADAGMLNDIEIIAWSEEKGRSYTYSTYDTTKTPALADSVSGIPIAPGDELTIYVKFTLENTISGREVSVDFDFSEVKYKIEYINNSIVLDTRCVLDNSAVVYTENPTAEDAALDSMTDLFGGDYTFDHWINAGSTPVTDFPVGHNEDEKLYPSLKNVFTATFVTQDGEILGWTLFTPDATGKTAVQTKGNSITAPSVTGFNFDYWQIQQKDDAGNITKTPLDNQDFTKIGGDITIYPAYQYSGDVKLIPVDSDGDGATNYYEIGGYGEETGEQELVVIPKEVEGIPITIINANAFSSYDDLHAVVIPEYVTTINSQAFSADNPNQWGTQRDTITMYYAGDPNYWNSEMNQYEANHNYKGLLQPSWDSAMGEGSRVFFLVDGKVDLSKGYWELADEGNWLSPKFVWRFHNHTFPYSSSGATCGYEHHQDDTDYDGNCGCDHCGDNPRPDIDYWTWIVTFDANGGTVSYTKQNVVYGATIGTMPTPTRDGYRFLGWFTGPIGGNQVNGTYIPTKDITLYAHWEENTT